VCSRFSTTPLVLNVVPSFGSTKGKVVHTVRGELFRLCPNLGQCPPFNTQAGPLCHVRVTFGLAVDIQLFEVVEDVATPLLCVHTWQHPRIEEVSKRHYSPKAKGFAVRDFLSANSIVYYIYRSRLPSCGISRRRSRCARLRICKGIL
jgi:hypothetical protein